MENFGGDKNIKKTSEIESVKKKRSFLQTIISDRKKISKDNIDKAYDLTLNKGYDKKNLYLLIEKAREIRTWVRNNQEYLEKIKSSPQEFEQLAEKAKEHKEGFKNFMSIGMPFLPEVKKEVNLYKAVVEKQIEIALKLYNYLYNPSNISNKSNPFSDENIIKEDNPFSSEKAIN